MRKSIKEAKPRLSSAQYSPVQYSSPQLSSVQLRQSSQTLTILTGDDGVESEVSQDSDEILPDSLLRIPDEDESAGFEILFAVEVVVKRPVERQKHRVAAEVPGRMESSYT